jgi:hypothetical protein
MSDVSINLPFWVFFIVAAPVFAPLLAVAAIILALSIDWRRASPLRVAALVVLSLSAAVFSALWAWLQLA